MDLFSKVSNGLQVSTKHLVAKHAPRNVPVRCEVPGDEVASLLRVGVKAFELLLGLGQELKQIEKRTRREGQHQT